MEDKNFTFDLANQKLLPMHMLERCGDCENARASRKNSKFAIVVKVVAIVTVVSACFTAITCAVYCNSALKDIRKIQAEIKEITKAINDTQNDSKESKRTGDISSEKFERLASQPKIIGKANKQNKGLFIDNPAIDQEKPSDLRKENTVDDIYDDSDYSDDGSDASDDEYGEPEDDYNDNDDENYGDEGYFDDLDDDYYDIEYDSDDDAESDKTNDDLYDTNKLLDRNGDYEEASGDLFDDEDLNRVRRDTEKQSKKKRKKGKGRGSRNRQRKPKQKKLKSLPAAQFNANITEEDLMLLGVGYNKYQLTDECAYSSEMNGVYCRNKTFTPNARLPLRIFKKESWVDDQKSPVAMKGKKFVVKNNGTHLVYGQITMEAVIPPVSASIARERHNGNVEESQYLTCTNDCINQTCTCSIFGLMNLRAKDTLHVQTNNGMNKILFEEAATYMGVVQLNRD